MNAMTPVISRRIRKISVRGKGWCSSQQAIQAEVGRKRRSRRIRQSCIMPDATLPRLIRPTIGTRTVGRIRRSRRIRQSCTMPDATLSRLIRPCIIPPVQRKSASFLCLQSACRIGPWVLTCCVDLCSGLPFSQSDKPDSIMDRFSR